MLDAREYIYSVSSKGNHHYRYHRKNLLLDVSMSCLLPWMIHSYSPSFESKVPFCRDLSLRVNRGPISRSRTFSDDLKSYMWCRKKM